MTERMVIKGSNVPTVAGWCDKVISPRGYWFHNKVGGEGWNIYNDRYGRVILEVDDEQVMTMALLKFKGIVPFGKV